MIDALQLCLAQPRDAAAILAVVHRAFAQYDGKLVPQSGAARETVETVTARLAQENCVMALREERLVGCLFYEHLGDHLYFGRLAVLPEERGRGVARRLVGEVEAVALAAGITTVALNVRIALPGNLALFAALGYREVSRQAHPGFANPTSIRMEKRLGA
jgi:GNAT superfamily N-acetyltransferase